MAAALEHAHAAYL